MSVLQSNCPSCAAPIEFKAGSTIVVVCKFCRSVVARTDRALEDLGKVAEIVETNSPLKVGLKGKYLDHGFELTGRAQLKHEAGGVWDEWYATFSNGWVGWLAEAQGRFYMTFYQPLPGGAIVPDYSALQVGQPFPANIGSGVFVVAEKGMATAIAAEGEIPYQLTPNETSYYADLSGADRAFATVDYSLNPPWMFVGKEVTLGEIGLENAKPAERQAQTVGAAGLSCPNCGGPINLLAPDASERVTCPNCDSLLDVQQGNLKYLHALTAQKQTYVLPIGAVGQLPGREPMQIIGATTRSVTIEGEKYFWQEYLLYKPSVGFCWLVESDNHWNFVETVAAGDITDNSFVGKGATVKYNGAGAAKGKTFKIFQHAVGIIEHVQGEFYWRVEVGEHALMTDYVNAPLMLSKEASGTGNSQEINWSLGTYLPRAVVEKAFNVPNLPSASNIAPNQPFVHNGLFKYSAAILILYIIVGILLVPLTGFPSKALNSSYTLPPMANPQAPQIVFSEPFDLKGNRNVEIKASAPVSNSWMSIDVDLVNDQNSEVESVPLDIEQYSGVEDGESWNEGSKENSAVLSSVPAGRYTMRIEGSWQNYQQAMPVTVSVEQNVPRGVNCLCGLIL
ncbi:MAG: DUF4178 domain-containing protein, partial [Pyrinomonadaceae bacterium]